MTTPTANQPAHTHSFAFNRWRIIFNIFKMEKNINVENGEWGETKNY